MNIKSKSVIVTGAGSGIGEAVARGFAAAGAKVWLFDRDLAAAEKVAKDIGGTAVECDVAEAKSAEAAFGKVDGDLRALVHCAGILIGKRILGKDAVADLEHFAKVTHVNLNGTFNMLRLAADKMQHNAPEGEDGERGVIITTASIAAYEGQVGQAAYAASKGGVAALTLPAARELGRFGIRVVSIAPGSVATPMIASVPDDIRKGLEDQVPFPKRFIKPEEIGKLALHIVDNAMLNGEVIRIDGAHRLPPK
ncbi:MAG: SDR family oxidoreductase [Alphaproteobacteria bacterium]|nr:SDR family oxidoreductase [Alphaproteobacteria bacterium]